MLSESFGSKTENVTITMIKDGLSVTFQKKNLRSFKALKEFR